MSKYETIDKTMSNSNEDEVEVRRGPWTLEEDNLLIHYISCNGEGRWNLLAKCAGLKRTGKSCRLRWLNYLKPDIKRGNLTPHEQLLILELHSKWGNRWSKIALHLPGRTDNEIKNYWRTRVQKQARQLKVDANSKTFLEVIRCYWMPRLLQKMEQNSSISTMENQDSIFTTLPTNHAMLESLSPNSADDHHHMENLNLSNFSDERVMNLPRTEENSYGDTHENDCYYFDMITSCYSSEYISTDQHAMSALGFGDISITEYLMVENHWCNDDVEGTIWNSDELWQV